MRSCWVCAMSRISEKRLAQDLAAVVAQRNPLRQRSDVMVILLTSAAGAGCNFLFGRVELAVVLWFVSLVAIADLVLSLGPLTLIQGIPRTVCDFIFAAAVIAILWLTVLSPIYARQHAALLSGVLHTPSDGKDHSNETPALQLSEGGPAFTGNNPLGIPNNRWSMHRDKNEILFSTTVRDKDGLLIVDIKDNHWTVASSTAQCWDKNYTDDSLEILDGHGRVVLQVIMKPTKIVFQAEYADLGGAFIDGRIYSKEKGIPPRFKYPSSDHWGELAAAFIPSR